jgi:hypothetical protein
MRASPLAAVRSGGPPPLRRPVGRLLSCGARRQPARRSLPALLADVSAGSGCGAVSSSPDRARSDRGRVGRRSGRDEPLPDAAPIRIVATAALPQLRRLAARSRARSRVWDKNRQYDSLGALPVLGRGWIDAGLAAWRLLRSYSFQPWVLELWPGTAGILGAELTVVVVLGLHRVG